MTSRLLSVALSILVLSSPTLAQTGKVIDPDLCAGGVCEGGGGPWEPSCSEVPQCTLSPQCGNSPTACNCYRVGPEIEEFCCSFGNLYHARWDPCDGDRDGILDDREEALLQTFAPRVWMHSGDWNKPSSVPWILARTYLRYTHPSSCEDCEILGYGTVTGSNITQRTHQTTSSSCDHEGPLRRSDSYSPEDFRDGFFLQQHNATHDGAHDDLHAWVAYGHVYPAASQATGGCPANPGAALVVQYWLFYPYNDGLSVGNHEGDWENVLLILDANDVPLRLRYSRHTSANYYDPSEVSWVSGTHPVVYAAKGSHANYAASSNGDCVGGPFYDDCAADTVWNTWDATTFGRIVHVGEKGWPQNNSNWLRYSGRWGEIGAWADTSGPKGPAYQWSSWHACGGGEVCSNTFDDDVDGTIDETDCVPAP